MEVSKKVEGTSAVVALSGRLDTNASVDFAKEMDDLLATDITDLVMDMSDCNYVASSGLRIVVNAQKVMDAKQGTLILKNVCGDVMEVFDMTGLSDLLTFES